MLYYLYFIIVLCPLTQHKVFKKKKDAPYPSLCYLLEPSSTHNSCSLISALRCHLSLCPSSPHNQSSPPCPSQTSTAVYAEWLPLALRHTVGTNENDYTQDSQVVSKATTSCLSVSMTSFLALSHTEDYLKKKG